MGYDLDIGRVAVLATAGGLMGILMMIPLRRALIVKEHGTLIYPEGTACAEVLIAGEERGLQAKRVFQAFGVGFVYKFLMGGLKLWPDVPGKALGFYPGAAVSSEISPELMGVGYIIGPRIAGYLFAGGCFAYLVLAPAIKLVGSGLSEPFGFPPVKLIRDMSPGELRSSFVFYIGAGAVASAGIIALARSLPTILSSFASSWKELRASRLGQAVTRLRTEDDLPLSLTVGGSIALAIVLTLLPQLGVNLLGAVLIVMFGFFFATVSSRICGQIGSSANPISGMTIAALLGTCLIFVAIGWTGVAHRVQAISIACTRWSTPVHPMATKIRHVPSRAAMVMPEIGFAEEPICPQMREETVAKKNPKITIRTAPSRFTATCGRSARTMARATEPPTVREMGRSSSVRSLVTAWPSRESRRSLRLEAKELRIVGMERASAMIPADATAPAPM